ncbi:UNVERIFIED_CONTAM: hypothetical protein Sindi_2588700 [Sesamum indicum]
MEPYIVQVNPGQASQCHGTTTAARCTIGIISATAKKECVLLESPVAKSANHDPSAKMASWTDPDPDPGPDSDSDAGSDEDPNPEPAAVASSGLDDFWLQNEI